MPCGVFQASIQPHFGLSIPDPREVTFVDRSAPGSPKSDKDKPCGRREPEISRKAIRLLTLLVVLEI